MNQKHHIAPEFKKEGFHCPHCDVYANQGWGGVFFHSHVGFNSQIEKWHLALCAHCHEYSFWVEGKLVYPSQITAPLAHNDMPVDVSEYYNEAREVSASSPRAAAALLRLTIKKLCESLGENDPNLNLSIGKLSEKGLPQNVIKSLDTVRIVGNEGGAHEGQIDLSGKDNKQIVDKLFWLVNFIIEKTITDPKAIEDVFSSLPEDKKQGVEQRDKKQPR